MTSPLEALVVVSLGAILSMTAADVMADFQDPFAGVTGQQLRQQSGVSEVVYNCAEDVLNNKTVDELVAFIKDEAVTAGTPDETPTATALKACVYKDPFGWAGTPNEWAIELLETEKWK